MSWFPGAKVSDSKLIKKKSYYTGSGVLVVIVSNALVRDIIMMRMTGLPHERRFINTNRGGDPGGHVPLSFLLGSSPRKI